MYERITASLESIAPFSEEQLAVVFQRLRPRTVVKDECLVKEGQVCQSFYFVDRGCFRHYHVQDNGEEATLNLFIPCEWLFEYKSLVTQHPSENIIRAAADSEVLVLNLVDIHELMKMSDIFFRLGRIFEQATQNQDFQHNRLTPEQKYERILATKPGLLQHFPLKHIASYLGMTPETLSRTRKKISS